MNNQQQNGKIYKKQIKNRKEKTMNKEKNK